MNTQKIIASVLSHPSAQDKTPEELSAQITKILEERRLLASTASPLALMIDRHGVLDTIDNNDQLFDETLDMDDQEFDEFIETIQNDQEMIDEAIVAVEPEFNFDKSDLEEEVANEVNRVNVEVIIELVKKFRNQ